MMSPPTRLGSWRRGRRGPWTWRADDPVAEPGAAPRCGLDPLDEAEQAVAAERGSGRAEAAGVALPPPGASWV